jgi:hypothetical protein
VWIPLLSQSREISESSCSRALAVPQRSRDQREHIGKPSSLVVAYPRDSSVLLTRGFCRALLLPSLRESDPCLRRSSVPPIVTRKSSRIKVKGVLDNYLLFSYSKLLAV